MCRVFASWECQDSGLFELAGYLDGSQSRLLSAAIGLKRTDFVWDTKQPVDHHGICSSIIATAIARSCHSVVKTKLDFSLEVAGIVALLLTNCFGFVVVVLQRVCDELDSVHSWTMGFSLETIQRKHQLNIRKTGGALIFPNGQYLSNIIITAVFKHRFLGYSSHDKCICRKRFFSKKCGYQRSYVYNILNGWILTLGCNIEVYETSAKFQRSIIIDKMNK